MGEIRRRASHAGSWYSASAQSLRRSLTRWLDTSLNAPSSHPRPFPALRAVIAPHAGYSYSGRIAAYAYSAVDTTAIKKVFVLGPSHHVYIRNRVAISTAQVLETPLGSLPVDTQVVTQLYEKAPHLFEPFDIEADEDEHSIEMHLPYLRHVFAGKQISIVPLVVGNLTPDREKELGGLLAPWLSDESTLFVLSSDFCHWGSRFDFVPYKASDGEIWESIEKLDRQGMESIESLDHSTYLRYQETTQNTICGRHAFGILLSSIGVLRDELESDIRIKFVKYDQSSKCRSLNDSSVSYASGWVYLADDDQ